MQHTNVLGSGTRVVIAKVPIYLSAIRIWEALFALPFGYIGMVLAAQGQPPTGIGGWPGWRTFVWITIAFLSVRTLGMFANRLIHAREDAANPRTANRHLPQGLLKPWEVMAMMALSTGVFFFAASQLNPLALALAPVAAAYVVLYSYTKYYTWACNLALGWALAMAPAAAWIGVTGRLDPPAVLLAFAVATWAGGFDIIYSLTDYDFDRSYHIHSIPARFGITGALRITRGLHLLAAASLLALGLWLGLGLFYYIGWAVAVALLIRQNSLVKANDLSRMNLAFFRFNSSISLALLGFTIVDLVV